MTKTILAAAMAVLASAEKERPASQEAKPIEEAGIVKSVYDNCIDTNFDYDGNIFGDSYGDVCSEYADYPNWCGNYDTLEFDSMHMCCACGGGYVSTIYDT